VHLEPHAVAEPEVEALREPLPRRLRALGGDAGRLEGLTGEGMEVTPEYPGANGLPRPAQALQCDLVVAHHLGGGSPTTKVRVMSAKQAETASRGQRSRVIGSPAGSGPTRRRARALRGCRDAR